MIEIHHKKSGDLLLQIEAEDLIAGGMVGKDLTGADLRHTVWFNRNLARIDFTNADLTGIKLPNCSLKGANLTNALLRGADLDCTDLSDCNLEGANLQKASLFFCRLQGANLQGVKIGYTEAEITSWRSMYPASNDPEN
ncbi:MAG: hypothetical protein JWL77_4691 [Chthonomonadaceae bacterium]|nr:hypothetical protein [Chthonomonadaceae bacterium]